jgi:hypothetical protein
LRGSYWRWRERKCERDITEIQEIAFRRVITRRYTPGFPVIRSRQRHHPAAFS